jgi:hypothetical protein
MINAEKDMQMQNLEMQLAKRKSKNSGVKKEDDDNLPDDFKSGINDDYDGVGDNNKGKMLDLEMDERPNKILSDDFLDNLKAADVPDSDDECYF